MNKKQATCMAAAALILTTVLAGCKTTDITTDQTAEQKDSQKSEASKEVAELTFYHRMNTMTDYIDAFVDKYNDEHPNVHITTDLQTDSAVLQARYAAGEDPDIVLGPQSTQYMVDGKYLALDEAMPELVESVKPELVDIVRELTTDHVYRLPTGMGTYGMFYDRTIFKELGIENPDTWEEFLNACRTVKEQKPDVYPFYLEPDNLGHQVYYLPLGLSMLDNGMLPYNKAATKNDQSILRFMEDGYLDLYAERLMEMAEEGLFDKEAAIVGNADTASEGFAQHKIAMMLDGTWWYGDAITQYPEMASYIGFMPIPSIKDDRDAYGSVDYDSCISISATSPYQEELKEFLTAWFDDAGKYCETRKCPCSVKGVEVSWGDKTFVKEVDDVLNNYETGVVQTESPNGFYTAEIANIVEEMLVGSLAPDDFAQTFTDEWNAAYGSK